jgi:hypothetical protein
MDPMLFPEYVQTVVIPHINELREKAEFEGKHAIMIWIIGHAIPRRRY